MLQIKKIIRACTPHFVLSWYHLALAFFAALRYLFPSKHMVIIGITGTKGKTSTVYLLSKILEEAGLKVAVSSSLMMKVDKKESYNKRKMTMAGRFALQKFLYQAKQAGCSHVIIEVTSEGIMQHRHRFINFDVSVFTNLTKEHIESHGSFENYKKAKGKLFEVLKKLPHKMIDGKKIEKISVLNMDDAHVAYFANFWADTRYGFGILDRCKFTNDIKGVCVFPSSFHVTTHGINFSLGNVSFSSALLGEFNIANALCAVVVAGAVGVDVTVAKTAIEKIKGVPGRAQVIDVGQSFTAIVDYAHTPSSYIEILKFAKIKKSKGAKIIVVFGSAGGGRDVWKRAEIGQIVSQYGDYLILTNEDPYNENPDMIFEHVKEGVIRGGFSGSLEVIRDRIKAIARAVAVAQTGDVVLFLGKGSERVMMMAKDESAPWNEAKIVTEELRLSQNK